MSDLSSTYERLVQSREIFGQLVKSLEALRICAEHANRGEQLLAELAFAAASRHIDLAVLLSRRDAPEG
ncbi:MAG: hypothetical protein MO847_08505 [Candidatus Protistobacter heckmanni]|nr:hypothetical protein [Candidatus Protistobacter heckmanni]